MFFDHRQYRVRMQNDDKKLCIIEADAPVDTEHLRAFITKTRRVFELNDDTEIQVLEFRTIIEQHNITEEVLNDESAAQSARTAKATATLQRIADQQQQRADLIRNILEQHANGELNPIDSYRAARELFDWDDEEQVS